MSNFVTVLGTIFMDCKGLAKAKYHSAGRNLGKIKFIHGGVGRNVAENLANLGIPSKFISATDATAVGMEVLERLKKSQVEIEYILEAKTQGMGMWLAILDEEGNLAGSISQMPDLSILESFMDSEGGKVIKCSSHLILELDLTEQISRTAIKLAKEYNKPVYGIPGNLEVILTNKDLLGKLDLFICNNFEADKIFQADFSSLSLKEKQEAVKEFAIMTGIRYMVVTLGEEGSVYFDSVIDEASHQPAFPVKLVDSSGAGDAFFSGTSMGLIKGMALKEAVIWGTKVAGWTIESVENTCLELQMKLDAEKECG